MRKLTLAINMSLDGYADHTVGVAADDEMHDFFTGLLDHTDIELLGRVTYQLMESYWPNAHKDPDASRSTLAFAEKYNAVRKIVFSRTLKGAAWNNTSVFGGNMVDEVIRLKQQPGRDIALGGISIAQEFMRRGLIDEYWIVIHPVVVGGGRRLFPGLDDKISLKLVDAHAFKSGAVALHYQK